MSRAEHHSDPALAELERQISATREQLGQTVEELAAKVDVPGRAKAKASETMARFRASTQEAEDRARSAAVQAADRVKHSASRGGGRHAARGREAAPSGGGGSGAHLATEAGAAPTAVSETGSHDGGHDKEKLAYGAAAVGLTAATAGAAVWASRHP